MSFDELDNKQTYSNPHDFKELISLGRGAPLPCIEARMPVHHFISIFANKKSNEIAVISGNDVVTYSELYAWATQIGKKLAESGIGPGQRVAVLIEPGISMVAATLGILLCGAAYVPLDSNQPLQRINTILTDASVSGIVSSDVGEQLSKLGFPLYSPETAPPDDSKTLLSSQVWPVVSEEDAAYLIYTSGSTGKPKGVLIRHGQLSDSTLARRTVYPGSPVFLLVSPLAFDSAAAGLWGTLTAGGQLIVASYDEMRDPEKLITLIKKFKITHFLCIPSLYDALLDVSIQNNINFPSSLNTVIVAGEVLHQSLVERHFNLHGKSVELVNEYGPTETTIWATYRRFNNSAPVSIGFPIPGIQVYVLNKQLQLTPRGQTGELFISGSQVSEGYFNQPNETEQAFFPDPFSEKNNVWMYRTGDLVHWNSDGTLHFVGRRDHQIKIRGHRIELGAIEIAVRGISGVRDAIVIPNREQTLLKAFVILSSSSSPENLREQLAGKLPEIMIPTQICVVDHFPLTISGKVDRNALNTAEDIKKDSINTTLPKQDELFELQPQITIQVTAAWNEVLDLKSVPLDVNFFDLGGHSLLVFKLQNALEKHTGKRPTVVSLFRHTTVSAQTKLIFIGEANISGATSKQNLTDLRRSRALRAQSQTIKPQEVFI